MREYKENLRALDKGLLSWEKNDWAHSEYNLVCASYSCKKAKNKRIAVNVNEMRSQSFKG